MQKTVIKGCCVTFPSPLTSLEQPHATRHLGKEGGGLGGLEEKGEIDGQLGLGTGVSRHEGSAL